MERERKRKINVRKDTKYDYNYVYVYAYVYIGYRYILDEEQRYTRSDGWAKGDKEVTDFLTDCMIEHTHTSTYT